MDLIPVSYIYSRPVYTSAVQAEQRLRRGEEVPVAVRRLGQETYTLLYTKAVLMYLQAKYGILPSYEYSSCTATLRWSLDSRRVPAEKLPELKAETGRL
jgi:hypothetical protein